MRIEKSFIEDIKNILQVARNRAYAAVNFYMVEAYWKIGERIVVEEQKGLRRAEYGTFLISELSKKLTEEYGGGFSEVALKNFRQFYASFSEISESQNSRQCLPSLKRPENQQNEKSSTVWSFSKPGSDSNKKDLLRRELTWSHYKIIMRVENKKARQYYMNEAADNNWSVRVLQRNVNTFYYERILSTNNKQEALKKAGLFEKHSPADFIKDPYLLEFLNIPEPHTVNERELEGALIENLKDFLIEPGKGFAFVNRQFRDNPTIGIILCTSKDATIVKYSVLKDNEQLFATKYKSYLPSEQELIAEIERNKHFLEEKLKTSDTQ